MTTAEDIRRRLAEARAAYVKAEREAWAQYSKDVDHIWPKPPATAEDWKRYEELRKPYMAVYEAARRTADAVRVETAHELLDMLREIE